MHMPSIGTGTTHSQHLLRACWACRSADRGESSISAPDRVSTSFAARSSVRLRCLSSQNTSSYYVDRRAANDAYDTERLRGGKGKVFLVGTGPGDPGLLTLRALQVMQAADVVLYDRLVSHDILQLVNPGAVQVYVGKESGYHTRTQDEIHKLLLEFSGEVQTIVRLKGGDPFIFGRGGEEIDFLRARGVSAFCIPGITAATGIAAELGIPLTHRAVANSVQYLTGHSKSGGEAQLSLTAQNAVDSWTTLVVYMGLQTLPLLVSQLRQCGLAGDTPSVAVERGTTTGQRVVFGELEALSELTTRAGLQSPTLVIVGAAVAMSSSWQLWNVTGRGLFYEQLDCPRTLLPPLSTMGASQKAGHGWDLGSGLLPASL